MKNIVLKNPIVKNVLSAVAVAGFGFILLNLAFLLDALFQNMVVGFVRLFAPVDLMHSWITAVLQALFALIISLTGWLVFRSKLGVLYKAIYTTVPMAVVLVTIAILLYRLPVAIFSAGGLVSMAVLYYFYRTKQPWIYYYAVFLVTLALAIMALFGVEI